MEYKLVDVTGGEQGTFIYGVEEKIKAELAEGWELWGSLIVIPPDFEGDQVRIWQAMVKEDGLQMQAGTFEEEMDNYEQKVAQRIREWMVQHPAEATKEYNDSMRMD